MDNTNLTSDQCTALLLSILTSASSKDPNLPFINRSEVSTGVLKEGAKNLQEFWERERKLLREDQVVSLLASMLMSPGCANIDLSLVRTDLLSEAVGRADNRITNLKNVKLTQEQKVNLLCKHPGIPSLKVLLSV